MSIYPLAGDGGDVTPTDFIVWITIALAASFVWCVLVGACIRVGKGGDRDE